MVAEYRVAPEPGLEPEGAVQERVVLLGGVEVEPDRPQAVPTPERGAGDVGIVVPDVAAGECR